MNRRWRRPLTRPWVLEGVALNDDFTDRKTDVPATLRARRPAWVGVQEGKRHDYADEIPTPRYGAVQRLATEATRGVAVVYDLQQVTPIGRHRDVIRGLGHGYTQLLPAGNGIMARGVAWRDVRVGKRGSRRQVRLASIHRPPARDRARWGEFDLALDAWLKASPIPVWLAGDFNTIDARRISTRGRVRLFHVDGHLITGRLRFRSLARALRWRTSDHRAVAALVWIPRRRRT